jgi:anti-sigma factor ChrR (cupin superfamily)
MADGQAALVWPDLLALVQEPDQLPWQAFRDGVEIYSIYGGGADEPAAALLRYAPGARVPRHEHRGYEHILVLQGEQEDEHGRYPAGSLVINRPGSQHSVTSASGCIVLIIWHRPVQFV